MLRANRGRDAAARRAAPAGRRLGQAGASPGAISVPGLWLPPGTAPSPATSARPPGAAMIVRVRLFARARDLAGTDAVALELPAGTTVGALRKQLGERWPA